MPRLRAARVRLLGRDLPARARTAGGRGVDRAPSEARAAPGGARRARRAARGRAGSRAARAPCRGGAATGMRCFASRRLRPSRRQPPEPTARPLRSTRALFGSAAICRRPSGPICSRQRSRECYLTDDIADAIVAVEEALEIRRALGQPLEEGRSLCWLSEILWCPGRTSESARGPLDAVGLLETAPAEPASSPGRTRGKGSVELMGRALELARELGDDELIVRALDAGGNAHVRRRRTRAARAGARAGPGGRARRARRPRADQPRRRRGRAPASTPSRLEYVDTAIDYCSEHGLELYRYYALAYRVALSSRSGAGTTRPRPPPPSSASSAPRSCPASSALVVLSLVRARRGDPGHRDLLEEAWTLAEPTRELSGWCRPRRRGRRSRGWRATSKAWWLRPTDILALAVKRARPGGRRRVGRLAAASRDRRGRPVRGRRAVGPQLSGDWKRQRRSSGASRLPLRGCARARRGRRRVAAPPRTRGAARPRGAARGGDRRRPPARAGRTWPAAWPAPVDPGQPRRADAAPGRGARARQRGDARLGDRRAARPLRADGRSPRQRDPAEARRSQPQPGDRRGSAPGARFAR